MTSFLPKSVQLEAARDHAAQMVAGLEQRDLQAFARRADRGDHASGGASVDHDIELLCGRQHAAEWNQQELLHDSTFSTWRRAINY